MQILITGGAGFIGSSLVRHHLAEGDKVYVIDDLSTGNLDNLKDILNHPNLTCYFQDLLSFDYLETLLEKIDLLYHFAAVVGVFKVEKEPLKVLDVNIQGTHLLLKAMQHIQSKARFILASTSEIYGVGSQSLLAENHDAIIDSSLSHRKNYAISKLVDEAYSLSFYQTYGLSVTILRIFNVIGRNQSPAYGMVVPRFIQAAISNQPLTIYGSGRQKRSFCDIRDFVSILVKIIHEPKTIGCIINIGHDEEISILDLAKRIIVLANSQSKMIRMTYEEAYGETFNDFKKRRPDLTYLRSLIDFKYQWDLDSTLLDLIGYARISL